MLAAVGTFVAVGNACRELLAAVTAAAGEVTASIDEDGFARWLTSAGLGSAGLGSPGFSG
jgi:hydroxymethylpyrimidine pyrophosphatase-like HAD family hydrolase